MPRQTRKNILGFIDPITAIGVLFLVITLTVGVVVTKNNKISLNINEKAGSMCGYCNGATCVSCSAGRTDVGECTSSKQCEGGGVPGSVCGNGQCQAGETPQNCPNDCMTSGGPYCGDGNCNGKETASSCDVDCGNEQPACQPKCGGRACGDDGCGDICGSCVLPYTCNSSGQCTVPSCTPSCTGKMCGDNGCGGNCGTCPGGSTCQFNSCISNATTPPASNEPVTTSSTCGGTCSSSETCVHIGYGYYGCQATSTLCVPNCTGKQCGDNGCGGNCGTCAGGYSCQFDNCIVNTPTVPQPPVLTDPIPPVTSEQTNEDLSRDCFYNGGQWNNTTKTCFNPDIQDVADEAQELIANNPIINPPADDYDIESTRVNRVDDTASNNTSAKYSSKAECQANVNPNSKAYDACGQYATSSENQNVIFQNINELIASVNNPVQYANCNGDINCNRIKAGLDALIPDSYISYWQGQTGNQEVNFKNAALATYKMVTPDLVANQVLEWLNLRDEADSYLDIAFNQQTTLDTADLLTFDKTSRYVSNYQRINEQTYNSNAPDIVNYLNSFNAGIRDKETLASTIDLGVTISEELYMLGIGAPLALTAGGVIPGAVTLMGQAQVVSTVSQGSDATTYCLLNGFDENCNQKIARTGISVATIGVSQYANTFSNALGRVANTVTTGANFAVDSADAIVAFSDPNTDALTRAMSIVAVVGDIGGGVMDFNQGQLDNLTAFKTDVATIKADLTDLTKTENLIKNQVPKVGEFTPNTTLDIPLVEIAPAPKVAVDAGSADLPAAKQADIPVAERLTTWVEEKITKPFEGLFENNNEKAMSSTIDEIMSGKIDYPIEEAEFRLALEKNGYDPAKISQGEIEKLKQSLRNENQKITDREPQVAPVNRFIDRPKLEASIHLLSESTTGYKVSDPALPQLMKSDQIELRKRYELPDSNLRFSNPQEYFRQVEKLANEKGILIQDKSQYSEFFDENPVAQAVHFGPNDKYNLTGQHVVAIDLDNVKSGNNLESLDHELIHARQDEDMLIEIKEYQAYMASKNPFTNLTNDQANLIFMEMNDSVISGYKNAGQDLPDYLKPPVTTPPSLFAKVQTQIEDAWVSVTEKFKPTAKSTATKTQVLTDADFKRVAIDELPKNIQPEVIDALKYAEERGIEVYTLPVSKIGLTNPAIEGDALPVGGLARFPNKNAITLSENVLSGTNPGAARIIYHEAAGHMINTQVPRDSLAAAILNELLAQQTASLMLTRAGVDTHTSGFDNIPGLIEKYKAITGRDPGLLIDILTERIQLPEADKNTVDALVVTLKMRQADIFRPGEASPEAVQKTIDFLKKYGVDTTNMSPTEIDALIDKLENSTKSLITNTKLSNEPEIDSLVKYIVGPEIKEVPQLAEKMKADQTKIITEYNLPDMKTRFNHPELYRQGLIDVASEKGIQVKSVSEMPEELKQQLSKIYPSYIPPIHVSGSIYLPDPNSIKDSDLQKFTHELTHGLDDITHPDMSIEQKEYRAYIAELGDAVAVQKALGDNFVDFVFGRLGVRGSVERYYADQGIKDYPWNTVPADQSNVTVKKNPVDRIIKGASRGQGMTGLTITAAGIVGLGYLDNYFDWGIADKAVEIFNSIFGIKTENGEQLDKSITPESVAPEIYGNGANKLAEYLKESDVITIDDITPPDGLTKIATGKCQRVDRSNPCDGSRMYEMYLWYKSQPDGWWNTDGDFTPADFLALMLIAEAGGSDTEFLKSITTATSSQLWGSNAEHQAYCTTPDCEAGIFNFIGAYMQSASRRYNDLVLGLATSQETITNLDKQTVENFANMGFDLGKIANDTIYNPVSKIYDNDTPVHWGNFGCGPECEYLGPNWIKDANQLEVNVGTTDKCGLYDMYGQNGVLAVVYTNNQKYNWTIKNPQCFDK